jgi:transposase-like protein
MRARFSQSFKIQAVEKALSRSGVTTLKDVADSLGIGHSTLNKWMVKSRNQEFEPVTDAEISSLSLMSKEKRPQDWSLEEKLNLIITCGSLGDEAVSALCREQGIYPHHIKQWKQDFVGGAKASAKANAPSEAKSLKSENKALKKELNRKDKALAETAALLVLQKKVNAIWGSDEDNSQ